MASDVVSRPKYGFNSSYQFNDVAIPSDGRTSFAWYLIYKTIDNCNTAISIKGDSEELRQAQGQALDACSVDELVALWKDAKHTLDDTNS